jgi:hypothetical protein
MRLEQWGLKRTIRGKGDKILLECTTGVRIPGG